MKKLWIICLALLLLCGCGKENPPETEVPETTEPEILGFREVESIDGESVSIISRCAAGHDLVLLTVDEGESCAMNLWRIDPDRGEVVQKQDIGELPQDMGISDMEYRDGKILVVDEFDGYAMAYDEDFTYEGTVPWQAEERPDWEANSPFVCLGFSAWGDVARFYENMDRGLRTDCRVFPDDPELLYMCREGMEDLLAGAGKITMECVYEDSCIPVAVYDYDTCQKLNKTVIPEKPGYYSSVCNGYIWEHYAYLEQYFYNDRGDSAGPSLLIWDFSAGGEPEPADVEVVTPEGLRDWITYLSMELKEHYDIDVHVDQSAMEEIEGGLVDDTADILGAGLFPTYHILNQFTHFLSLFPEGLLPEIYEEYPDSEGMDLYIVKEIEGDTAAYANIWGDKPLITFAADEFFWDHMPHEFTHIMDNRIFNYYDRQGGNYWEDWEKFNPEDFYYGTADAEWYGENERYFISSYAMTSQMEDRADLFAALLRDSAEREPACWYADNPPIQAKIRELCRVWREVYPSLGAAGSLPWETWLTENP